MIARIWHGFTAPQNADAYDKLLQATILPGIHRTAGYKGAYRLRRERDNEVEFVTITLWESMEAVEQFAGRQSGAVVPAEAQRLLRRFDEHSEHYDGVWVP